MSNKLANESYFLKRLRDSGYNTIRLFNKYSDADNRKWTILIDPGVASVYCTCYEITDVINDKFVTYFELYDGGRYIPTRYCIDTESIEVILDYLVRFNINNKHPDYGKSKKSKKD